MKPLLYLTILLSAVLPMQVVSQGAMIFPKGEKAANVHHTGNVWLHELVKADNILDCHVSVATFDADARLDWHSHPGGQILLITEGTGYYQEKDKPKQIVNKGSVIKCLPGIEHWHGASPESGFAYIAVNANNDKGKTIWGQKVTDEQYYGANSPVKSSTNTEQEIINLSKQKWIWMAEKRADTLAALFHEKSMFVHMGGSWGKEQEINVIKSGGIHYKKADIHEVSVTIIDNTAILLNRITLLAAVGGNEVTNPFMVTEVYIKENGKWMLGSLSFTKLMGQ
jgi:4-carboxymuconolactone decarboxylase